MSYYGRLRVGFELADNASYYNPSRHDSEATLTPDEGIVSAIIEAAVAGTTFSLSAFTTITALVVENLASESGEYVSVAFENAAADAPTLRVSDDGIPLVAQDVDPTTNLTLTSSGASAKACKITVVGT
jgi:hypothetical protein